jgi:hypothetical protein
MSEVVIRSGLGSFILGANRMILARALARTDGLIFGELDEAYVAQADSLLTALAREGAEVRERF